MARKKEFILPCGALVEWKEYMWEDIISTQKILENTPKEKLAKYIDPYTTGRKYDIIAYRLGVRIVKLLFKHIVNRLMESQIFDMGYNQKMFIGVVPNNPDKIAKDVKKKRQNWHTMGKRYSVVMESQGKRLDIQFRMPKRRREELYKRIMNGQNFYK